MEERFSGNKRNRDTVLTDISNLLSDHQKTLSDISIKNDARRLRLEALKARKKAMLETPIRETLTSEIKPLTIS